MGSITFSGLASGLDTGSMVDKLVALERSAANAVTVRQSNLESKKSIVGSLSTALSTLATAARALDLDTEIKPRAVSVSDARVSLAVSAGAAPGVHDLRVKNLASAQVVQSSSFAGSGAGVAGTGGVDITVGGSTKSVAWDATDSLQDIADRISGADAGVHASVLEVSTGNFRLVVTSKDTGTSAAPTFTPTGASLGLEQPGNITIAAADAVVAVNGIDVTRASNVMTDVLAGVTLTLNSVHDVADPSAKATVSLDQKALTEKVRKLVDSYNAVNLALNSQLTYTGTKKGENTLFGDSTLRQLQSSLGTLASNAYGDATLSTLGISRDKTGVMSLDDAKLAAAVTENPNAVSELFVTNGFATTLATMADEYTRASDGVFAMKTQSLTDRQKTLQEQVDRINDNADKLQVRLERQFGALEQAMSLLQSQSAQLLAVLQPITTKR